MRNVTFHPLSLALAAILLAGCAGGGSTPGPHPTPKPSPRPTATPMPTATPRPSATPTPTPTPTPAVTRPVEVGWQYDGVAKSFSVKRDSQTFMADGTARVATIPGCVIGQRYTFTVATDDGRISAPYVYTVTPH